MKKFLKRAAIILIILLFAGIYYYVSLPAINIHSKSFWMFLLFFILVCAVFLFLRSIFRNHSENQYSFGEVRKSIRSSKIQSFLWLAFVVLLLFYILGSVFSSPVINAKKYQKLMKIEEREFTEDIKEVDYNTIPLLDKDSASLLGDRKMGNMVDMVSQFEVGNDYTQINYKGKPVRVTPLVYASPVKWFTNHKSGIPAYIMIDMTTQDTECIKLNNGIKYSKSEYFNRNLYRHLRFHYPTYIFDDQLFFEVDDEGTPFWVCPVKKFNIGLFGGQTVGRVVLCNAVTGECIDYDISDVPQWIDKVYSAELLMRLYDYAGIYVHGFWNSYLGQKDCLRTTNGYNYIALDDDLWVYTGITSVNGDQSNVGFILMNQRTMETRYYKVEGAIEDSAQLSAEGQVQNLGYRATFPLLLNISDEPTYFMALKDDAGLVKKYAMVNVHKYQWVAIGDTIKECEKNYIELLKTNGISNISADQYKTVDGMIDVIVPVVIEGNTHYYICLRNESSVFDADLSNMDLIDIIKYKSGDYIKIEFGDVEDSLLKEVKKIR